MAEIVMEVLNEKAEFFAGPFRWSVPGNPIVQDMLNETVSPGGPEGADPYWPNTVAEAVKKRYGGKVIEIVKQNAFNPDVLY